MANVSTAERFHAPPSTGAPSRWLWRVVETSEEAAPVFARLALGIVMFPHGAQKVFGWFGGHGLSATMHGFMSQGIPGVFAALAIAAEFLGSIGLITGTLARVAALGLGIEMIVAALLVHAKHGFFMNWMGKQAGEGFEYHILTLGLALVVLWMGAGAMSVDRAIERSIEKRA